jgi:hypothetical protein
VDAEQNIINDCQHLSYFPSVVDPKLPVPSTGIFFFIQILISSEF